MASNPTSRLIIKDHQIDDPAVRQTLLEKFASRGVNSDRISLLGSTSRQDHLLTLQQIDVCLDPFPHSGGVSTWEPLHLGVPVVTKIGSAGASRAGAAILVAAGLPDFIGSNDEDYIQIAANPNPERLRTIRRGLPEFIYQQCGPTVYTSAVEDAYRTMWKAYCASPPAEFKQIGKHRS